MLSALECQVIGAASEGVDPVESGQVHETQLIGAVSLITGLGQAVGKIRLWPRRE